MKNYILLVLITMIWGFGFIGVKWTLLVHTPMESNFVRFIISTIFVIPIILIKKEWKRNWEEIKATIICGFFLFGLLFLQTTGMKYTTVAKSGFLTTLYAFFTPLLAMIFYRKRFSFVYWILVGIGLLGICLLCNLSFNEFNYGDILTVLCALCAALHIICVERYAKVFKSGLIFNCFQIFVVTIISAIVFSFNQSNINWSVLWDFTQLPVYGYIEIAILSSIVAFSFQAAAQKDLPAEVVSTLFLLESPFAAIFGFLCLGEMLNKVNIIGCFLIIFSVASVPYFSKTKSNPA